jgi:hypothetical protein
MAATNAISTRLIAFMFSLAARDDLEIIETVVLGAWPYRYTTHPARPRCEAN